MKHIYKIGLFTFFIVIATFNSFGQCGAKSNYFSNFGRGIWLNSKESDCLKFKPTTDLNNLLGLSANKIRSLGEVIVHGTPDIVQNLGNKENGMKNTWQVSLQITCAGASSPRIGYGPTRLYFAAPFEKDGSLVEFKPGRSFGYGESDKSSVKLLGEEFTEGGARVFPITEFVRCDDRDDTKGSKIVKDIKGDTRMLQPGISFLNNLRFARPSDNPKLDPNDKRFVEDSDEEVDKENIPTGKFLLQCFLLNINPKVDESFQLILWFSRAESLIRTYTEKDGHASCEIFTLDEPGWYGFKLRFQPYNVESDPIVLTRNAVKK